MLDALVHDRTIFRCILLANLRRQWLFVLHLLAGVCPVVFGAQVGVGAVRQLPVDQADPVVGFGVLRFQLNVLLVVAKKETVEKISNDTFEISVKEKAERNMANNRIISIIRDYFQVAKGQGTVRIISGHHSPSKIFSVEKEKTN